jgi:hypothetical protein
VPLWRSVLAWLACVNYHTPFVQKVQTERAWRGVSRHIDQYGQSSSRTFTAESGQGGLGELE